MTLLEIQAAVEALRPEQQQELLEFLVTRLHASNSAPASPEAPDARHSVLDIPSVSVGRILRPFTRDDDLLEEMLEGRSF